MNQQRVGIYIRTSTSHQNPEMQLSELESYICARNWNLTGVYSDQATGRNDKRPGLQAMLKDARQRKLDTIVIWKLDRLFRSLKHLVVTLEEFEQLGIKFVSLKDNLDLTTSSGRLLTNIIASMSEFEADLIRERVQAGLNNAKQKGIQLGRPSNLDLREVIKLRKMGLSLRQIAQRLNTSHSSVVRALERSRDALRQECNANP